MGSESNLNKFLLSWVLRIGHARLVAPIFAEGQVHKLYDFSRTFLISSIKIRPFSPHLFHRRPRAPSR
jgi:hypothetical protein